MQQSLSFKIIKNVAWNFIGNGWLIFLMFFTTPYIVRKLDINLYGVYVLVSTIIGYFGVLQLGLIHASIKYISQYLANDEKDKVRKAFWTCIFMYIIMGTLGTVIIYSFAGYFVQRFLSMPENLKGIAVTAIKIGSIGFLFVMITGVINGALRALLRFDLLNKIVVFFGTLQLLFTVALLYFGYSLTSIIASNVILQFLNIFVYWYYSVKELPCLAKPTFDAPLLLEMLKYGGFISIFSVTEPVLKSSEKIFLSSLWAVSSLTYYYIPQTIISRLAIIPSSVLNVLFPVFSRYHEQKESSINEELFSRSILYLQFIYVYIMFFLLFFGKAFFVLWIGNDFAQNSYNVMSVLAIAGLFNTISQPSSTLLMGFGRPHTLAFINVATTVIYLPVSYLAVKHYGPIGASCAWLFISVLGFFLLSVAAWQSLRFNIAKMCLNILYRILPASVFSLLIYWPLRRFHYPLIHPMTIFGIVLVTGVYFVSIWLWGLDDFARMRIREFFEATVMKFKGLFQRTGTAG